MSINYISKRSLFLNFILCIIILLNSTSWAELMIITTSFNILGYMGAPISLAVLCSKNFYIKIGTLIVFIILSLLLTTLPHKDLLLNNSVISIIMFFIQLFK